MRKPTADLDRWQLTESIERMEQIVSTCLIAYPSETVQLCRAARLNPGDFIHWPHDSFARAAFSAVAVLPEAKRTSSLILRAAKALAGMPDKHDRNKEWWLWWRMEGTVNRHIVATVIGKLARVASLRRMAEKYRRDAFNAMSQASREALGFTHEDLPRLELVGHSGGVADGRRGVSPARRVGAVGSGSRVDHRRHPRSQPAKDVA
jgi:hypothetical protein